MEGEKQEAKAMNGRLCERLLIKWKDVSETAAQTEVYEAFQLEDGMEIEDLLGTTIFKHSLSRHLVAGYRRLPSAIRWEFSTHFAPVDRSESSSKLH